MAKIRIIERSFYLAGDTATCFILIQTVAGRLHGDPAVDDSLANHLLGMAACCGDERRTERQRGLHPLQAGSGRNLDTADGRRSDPFRSYLSVAATH